MEDGEWRTVAPGAVLSGEVVEELVCGDLCEEVVSGCEAFDVEEVGLDGGVDGLDVGVHIAASGRDVGVGCLHERLDGVDEAGEFLSDDSSLELGPVVCLDVDLCGVDAAVPEVFKEAFDGELSVVDGEGVAVGEELSTGGDLSDGVLEAREVERSDAGVVVWDVVEVFDVHLEACEGLAGLLDGPEIVPPLVLPSSSSCDAVLPLDSCDGVDTVWEIELVLEMSGAEARCLLRLSDDDLLGFRRELVWAGVRSSALVPESAESFGSAPSDPLPDGVPGAPEGPGSGSDAVFPGVLNHPEPEIEDVVFRSNHVIVPDGAHEHLPAGCRDEQSNGGVSLCPPFSCWSDVGVA